MSSTNQSQSIANANQVISLAAQLAGLYDAITAVNNSWTDDGSLTVVQALATAAQNADGSLGTADATPVNTHPVDTRVAANQGLSRAVSSSQITSMLTQLNNVVSYINGNALTATTGVRAVLNTARGG